jgi:hypothetical protein
MAQGNTHIEVAGQTMHRPLSQQHGKVMNRPLARLITRHVWLKQAGGVRKLAVEVNAIAVLGGATSLDRHEQGRHGVG